MEPTIVTLSALPRVLLPPLVWRQARGIRACPSQLLLSPTNRTRPVLGDLGWLKGVEVQQQTGEVPAPRSRCLEWERQQGAGKPPSTRLSQVGEVLQESEQGDIRESESLALGQGTENDNLGL
nr:unnamed protein product [Rangifer tarandus platyrhynchus]